MSSGPPRKRIRQIAGQSQLSFSPPVGRTIDQKGKRQIRLLL